MSSAVCWATVPDPDLSRLRPRCCRKKPACWRVPCRTASSSSSVWRWTSTTRARVPCHSPPRPPWARPRPVPGIGRAVAGLRAAEAGQDRGQQVGCQVERADPGQVARQLAGREPEQRGLVDVVVGGEAGRFRLALGGPDEPGGVGLGLGQDALALGLALGLDAGRGGLLGGAAALVRALLLDQLLLAPGELDLALQLVLGDGPLALDRQGPPLVGGPVGLLLDLLAGRGLQRPLDLGLGPHRHHPHVDHGRGRCRPGGCRRRARWRCARGRRSCPRPGPGSASCRPAGRARAAGPAR